MNYVSSLHHFFSQVQCVPHHVCAVNDLVCLDVSSQMSFSRIPNLSPSLPSQTCQLSRVYARILKVSYRLPRLSSIVLVGASIW
jgi:hypothetical protein